MARHVIELAAAYPIALAEFALKSGIEEYHQMAKQALGVIDSDVGDFKSLNKASHISK